MITLLLFAVGALIAFLVFRKVKNSGYWDEVVVEVQEKPAPLGKGIEIFYKHHVGAYSKSGAHAKEVRSLLPAGTQIIALYYDNPRETRDELCQSALGCIYASDGSPLMDEHFASNLTRWGYERMTIRPVERAVVCKQKFTGFFSLLHLANHSYPALNRFNEENRFNCRLTVEVVANDELTVFCPLDHTEEFVVPEVIPTDELEERLAFQPVSSEDASGSELSGEEDNSSADEAEDHSQSVEA